MNVRKMGKTVATLLALIFWGLIQVACGLPANQGVDSSNQTDIQPPSVEEEHTENEEAGGATQSEEDSSSDDQNENPVEPEFGSDTLPCPLKDSTLILGFDHALTVNYEETSISHFLHQGWLELKVIDENGTIASEGSPTIPYSMEGVMSAECTLTADGSMTPAAHGSCEAGVVNLIIEENWTALEGQMECIDSDGDVIVMPFKAPAMGVQVHSGQNGTGEIFYVVEGGEGYSSMRPFVEGEGYHTWTLYTEEVPLVPLVPED